MQALTVSIALLAAYLIGSLSFAVIVSRLMGLDDPRSNTPKPTMEQKLAMAMGGDGDWVEESIDADHRRLRRGNVCVRRLEGHLRRVADVGVHDDVRRPHGAARAVALRDDERARLEAELRHVGRGLVAELPGAELLGAARASAGCRAARASVAAGGGLGAARGERRREREEQSDKRKVTPKTHRRIL